MAIDLSSIVNVEPADPTSLLSTISGNITSATSSANEAAALLQKSRNEIEAGQETAALNTAKSYATDVASRKTDLSVTADAAAALKEIQPSTVETLPEFAEESSVVTEFANSQLDVTQLTEVTDLSTVTPETATVTDLVAAHAEQAAKVELAVATGGTSIVAEKAVDVLAEQDAFSLGDAKSPLQAVESGLESAVSDPDKLVANPTSVMETAAEGGLSTLKKVDPSSKLSSSVTAKSMLASVSSKALNNTKAVQADPSIFDKCVSNVQKYTGTFTKSLESKTTSILSKAVDNPSSIASSSTYSSAAKSLCNSTVSKLTSVTASGSKSLLKSGLSTMTEKIKSGAISSAAGQKATSMFNDALSLPGGKAVGRVGQKIMKKAQNKVSSKSFSKINSYVSKGRSLTNKSVQSMIKSFF